MNRKQKKLLARIVLSVLLLIGLNFANVGGIPRLLLYMLPYLISGYDILLRAAHGLFNRCLMDENFLMAAATIGAVVLAVFGGGDYTEAVAVMVFYQTGELFQSIAVGRSRKSIGELMDIRPDHANLESGGEVICTDPEEVPVGSIIVIRPGERVPIDGVVIEGSSSLDLSALTGESLPADISPSQPIRSGCINMTGLLRVRTTHEFGESTASRILELVENAGSRKSRSEAFITRFARVYTPAVCIGALALAALPPLCCILLGQSPEWGEWTYRALTFLVISCPCALVISIPLTFFAALGGAGSAGILIKGSNFVETASRIGCAVMDKTGTLTTGSFGVRQVRPAALTSADELLRFAAHAESASSHPIARSIVSHYQGRLDTAAVTDIHEAGGGGVTATVDGRRVAVGNERLMRSLNIPFTQPDTSGSVAHCALDGRYMGYILIADSIKPSSAPAIAALRGLGVNEIVMLTGDTESAARETARELGVTRFFAQLLPEGKVERVEELLGGMDSGSLAFVGDGINDAPVLARADIGIAMGALGSDAAIEAADIVLMDDDPMRIPLAIAHCRRCMRIVYQNIAFAIGVKAVCLALGAMGIANMWLAIFADVGVMVIAVLNAIRALRVRDIRS